LKVKRTAFTEERKAEEILGGGKNRNGADEGESGWRWSLAWGHKKKRSGRGRKAEKGSETEDPCEWCRGVAWLAVDSKADEKVPPGKTEGKEERKRAVSYLQSRTQSMSRRMLFSNAKMSDSSETQLLRVEGDRS